MQGRSMVPVLKGQTDITYEDDTAVSWENIGLRAVRMGDYKLVWLPEPFGTSDWQLYDLAHDPAELDDLSQMKPSVRKKLIGTWEAYAKKNGVVLPPDEIFELLRK